MGTARDGNFHYLLLPTKQTTRLCMTKIKMEKRKPSFNSWEQNLITWLHKIYVDDGNGFIIGLKKRMQKDAVRVAYFFHRRY
jgi:hypothetical protein